MSAPAPLPAVTIVIPLYNEEQVLPELCRRLAAMFDAHREIKWDALLVNDGSRDRSAALVREQAARDPRFALLEFSRNFGFQAALAAGLAHATGDAVVTMDADLQDPPEVIPELVACWRGGAEVVRAVRRSREETGVRRFGMDIFHSLFGRVADFPIEKNTGTFGLVDRLAIDAVNRLPERNRFYPGLRTWVGFTTGEVLYDRRERAARQHAHRRGSHDLGRHSPLRRGSRDRPLLDPHDHLRWFGGAALVDGELREKVRRAHHPADLRRHGHPASRHQPG